MRLRWLIAALILSLIVALAQHTALTEYLYWRFVWIDVPMHLLGGITIGVFAVALLKSFRPRAYILFFALIAIGWEVFEYYFGVPREQNYAFDTALDLLMGSLGAITTYVVARLSVWRSV